MFNTGCATPVVIAAFVAYGVSELLNGSEIAFGVVFVILLIVLVPALMRIAEEEDYQRYAKRRNRQAAKRRRYDSDRR